MSRLQNAWYSNASWLNLFKPLSSLYKGISEKRRRQYQSGQKSVYQSRLPLIIIGNITVGGTGKTPLVIYLAEQLKAAGFKPGIVSRGYRSKAPSYPFSVKADSNPVHSGDEALLIAKYTQCPVIIDAKRVKAVQHLEQNYQCDVILSDDGLQHYAMGRDLEIIVVDGNRGFGNGCLLPQGPLRELPSRLKQADYIICNGQTNFQLPANTLTMQLVPRYLCRLIDNSQHSIKSILDQQNAQKVHAVAGIGNPERFFNSLCACGFDIISHVFEDHHHYSLQDIIFKDKLNVIMTEKDAIKCTKLATGRHWFLKVVAELEDGFIEGFIEQVKELATQKRVDRNG